MNAFQVIFGIITGLGGLAGVAALINARVQGRKIKAEAAKIGVDADLSVGAGALDMYREARTEAREAKEEARDCRVMVNALLEHVDELEDLMREAGLRPPPFSSPIPPNRFRRA